jgi:hypothetical protein
VSGISGPLKGGLEKPAPGVRATGVIVELIAKEVKSRTLSRALAKQCSSVRCLHGNRSRRLGVCGEAMPAR